MASRATAAAAAGSAPPAPPSHANLELSLMASVPGDAVEGLRAAFERYCGPPAPFQVLDTVMSCGKAEVRIQWAPPAPVADLVMYDTPLKVTVRPEQRNPLSEMTVRPMSISKSHPDHVKALVQSGYVLKYRVFRKGLEYRCAGRVRLTLVQIFSPADVGNDYAKTLVSPDWLVTLSVTTVRDNETAEASAALLLGIANAFRERVAFVKM